MTQLQNGVYGGTIHDELSDTIQSRMDTEFPPNTHGHSGWTSVVIEKGNGNLHDTLLCKLDLYEMGILTTHYYTS